MYAIYGNMDPINIPPMLAYIYHTWIQWINMILLKWNLQTDPLPTSDPRLPMAKWRVELHATPAGLVVSGPLVFVSCTPWATGCDSTWTKPNQATHHFYPCLFVGNSIPQVSGDYACQKSLFLPRNLIQKKKVTPIFQSCTPNVLWNLHAFKAFL